MSRKNGVGKPQIITGRAVQFSIGNVISGGGPAQAPGELRHPDAGVHLIQRRIEQFYAGLLRGRPQASIALVPGGPSICFNMGFATRPEIHPDQPERSASNRMVFI